MTTDSFEDILARCLLRVEEEGIEALEAFCVQHPDHAERLRARVADLVRAAVRTVRTTSRADGR